MHVASSLVLIVIVVGFMIQNHKLRKQIADLKSEAQLALEDDNGLMAQLETAAAAGSVVAHKMLAAANEIDSSLVTRPSSFSPIKRMLRGGKIREFKADVGASSDSDEKKATVNRWHKKGYIFPSKVRKWLIERCDDQSRREFYRGILDEQDRSK